MSFLLKCPRFSFSLRVFRSNRVYQFLRPRDMIRPHIPLTLYTHFSNMAELYRHLFTVVDIVETVALQTQAIVKLCSENANAKFKMMQKRFTADVLRIFRYYVQL